MGTVDPGHGKAKVTVDGKETEINTYASKRAIGQIIFTSEDLTDGEHTLKLEVSENNKAIGVERRLCNQQWRTWYDWCRKSRLHHERRF